MKKIQITKYECYRTFVKTKYDFFCRYQSKVSSDTLNELAQKLSKLDELICISKQYNDIISSGISSENTQQLLEISSLLKSF